jgi:hypothetical protein
MYQIIETANGWILQPQSIRYDGNYIEYSKVYVFNDIDLLNKHLKQTLTVLSDKSIS